MADTITFTANPLIYGTCGQIPMETSDKKCYLVTIADTVAAAQGHWTDQQQRPNSTATPMLTMEAATDDDTFPAWIRGDMCEIETVQLEAAAGTDMRTAGAVRFIAIGLK